MQLVHGPGCGHLGSRHKGGPQQAVSRIMTLTLSELTELGNENVHSVRLKHPGDKISCLREKYTYTLCSGIMG